jgi:hypothetical protein
MVKRALPTLQTSLLTSSSNSITLQLIKQCRLLVDDPKVL